MLLKRTKSAVVIVAAILAFTILIPQLPGAGFDASAKAKMTVTSTGIKDGKIAEAYGMYGTQKKDGIPTLSLPLTIKNAPAKTAYYAVLMDDPDAGNFIHWMAANIKGAAIAKDASIKKAKSIVQGKNDFGTVGYGGPTPPDKTHNYTIKVYALSEKVSLSKGFSKAQFNKAIKGKILATATVKGKYVRK